MKLIKLTLIALLAMFSLSVNAARKDKKAENVSDKKAVYAFGIGVSLNDSVIYFTDIQLLDSVHLGKKDFLPNRSEYSNELSNYLLNAHKIENATSAVVFSVHRKKLQRISDKAKAKYLKSKIKFMDIALADFKFTKPVTE